MDLISEDSVGAFGLLVAEAIEQLVDSHDDVLDKRAAMLSVVSPTMTQSDGTVAFRFKVKGPRQKPIATQLTIAPTAEVDDADFDLPQLASLGATVRCRCVQFARDGQCPHTLAVAWWLQEQLGRRKVHEVLEFFSSMQPDTASAGRELVDTLIDLADQSDQKEDAAAGTRVQWRIGLSDSHYYSPVSITAYEQRPRKNGKGWTKGKQLRGYDLLQRESYDPKVDGQIAALIST
ncbi:MAG: ATP-dependent helicase, partial [Planctomycetota bacterium]